MSEVVPDTHGIIMVGEIGGSSKPQINAFEEGGVDVMAP